MATTTRGTKRAAKRDAEIAKIATSIGFETLEERKMDALDFREVSVWEIKRALEAAYAAGLAAAGGK